MFHFSHCMAAFFLSFSIDTKHIMATFTQTKQLTAIIKMDMKNNITIITNHQHHHIFMQQLRKKSTIIQYHLVIIIITAIMITIIMKNSIN